MSNSNKNKEEKNKPEGYRGALRQRLLNEGIGSWSKVRILKGDAKYEGVLDRKSVV